jgi:starch phosphorylase
LVNLNLENSYKEALEELGFDLNEIYRVDDEFCATAIKNTNTQNNNINSYNNSINDLAESLVDSLATLELPAWGYGLRYKFGNLKQYKKSLNPSYNV